MFRAMPTTTLPPRLDGRLLPHLAMAGLLLALLSGCERRGGCTGDYCGTIVIAAAGEPDILLPPVGELAASRDVYDQLFLKLADLGTSGDRKSTRLNSSHRTISYAVFCLKN